MASKKTVRRSLYQAAAVAALFVLTSCKNPMPPPPGSSQSPPGMPGIPTPIPSPPLPGPPSQPGQPSTQPSSKPPSSPSTQPGEPGVALPSPGLPGPRDAKPPGSKGSKGGEPGDPSDQDPTAEPGEKEREQAGIDLQKAGDRVGEAADKEYDPLVKAPATDSNSDEGADGDSKDAAKDQAGAQEDDDPLLAENDDNPDPHALPAEDVSEAMKRASEALKKAGVDIASARTEEELRAAEGVLARARVLVLVAEEDIEGLRDEGYVVDEQVEILADAERMIIVASKALILSREMPDPPTDSEPREGELDAVLEESLVIFDNTMAKARETVVGSGPAPEGPTVASLPTVERETGGEELGSLPEVEAKPEDVIASAGIPEDIPSGQDDDIIARQLREAAIAETDQELKNKLWEEYKRYKAGTR